jgi:hypothetical protein
MSSASPNPLPPEPRRFLIPLPRPLWIGLAASVLIVAAAALHFGAPLYRQHVAVREVERANGKVHSLPRGPQWLRDWVGEDRMKLFDDPIVVDLNGSAANEDTLRRLGELTSLRALTLDNMQVTDTVLAHLKGLTNLERLQLQNTLVTDEGLRHLKGLTNLKILFLHNTLVTDAGLPQLKGLVNLDSLNLNGTRVTDAGLSQLKGLVNLKNFWISNTSVTDTGTAELRRALPDLNVYR